MAMSATERPIVSEASLVAVSVLRVTSLISFINAKPNGANSPAAVV